MIGGKWQKMGPHPVESLERDPHFSFFPLSEAQGRAFDTEPAPGLALTGYQALCRTLIASLISKIFSALVSANLVRDTG
jgi:hypothetical protein